GVPEIAEVGVLRFRDDARYCVETVDGLTPPLERHQKWIINVSTQFGCPVGCPFCDAALAYHGNLTMEELHAQVRWALGRHPGVAHACAKLKVHFARMGEPSLNDAVLEAMDGLPGVVDSPGLWACVATTAPRGRDAWFARLAELKERRYRGRFQLQFSVQSTDARDRARLTPIPHWSLAELADYGSGFWRPGDRKVILNFALARDIAFDAEALVDTFDPERFAVKITPVNPTARGREAGFATVLRSEREAAVERARQALLARGFDVILSIGEEEEDLIGSNCGQAVRVARPAPPSHPLPATASPEPA
ncbi:MAG: radical SAM protein, partial [Deltaproteobacteria bacterium]|nr:radical SAM protein [Deltaproteobacteria bacterium]